MAGVAEKALCLLAALALLSSGLTGAGILTGPRNIVLKGKQCCRRQPHYIFIGKDVSSSPVSMDIGKCHSHCGNPQRSVNYNSELLGFPKHLSVLEQLQTKKKRLLEHTLELSRTPMESSCPRDSLCEPVRMRVERFQLFDGVRELEVIEECQCNVRPTACVRSLLLKTYSPDSPLEVTVDVGKCSNPTAPGGLGCVPTKFESVLLESPNGLELIQTVELCEMRENCYRLPHVEYYCVITVNSSGEKEERLKEIDVGRCLGVCTAGSGDLVRDIRSKDQCVVCEDGSSNGCFPGEYETHTFRSRRGKFRTVNAIKSCKCLGANL
ncbi:uncharacterized protein pnhd isoform X1 [Scyliorhinus torazame]|uniref:uncharacterized protein pnhd isoform X1 n=1 Tax=Scyliorhinus torazame TaxID=75743 RepID=UPI003B591150